MNRTNTIGIVGQITQKPALIMDAADWRQKVYETSLKRMRPGGKEDTYILRFDGAAAGNKEMMEKITAGTEVMIGGEIRTENVHNKRPEENKVKVCIFAEIIAVNDPPVEDQNEVKLFGKICKQPYHRETAIRTKEGEHMEVVSMIVAVKSMSGFHYIPCVYFYRKAFPQKLPKKGEYVEIYGRFQSRVHKKKIEGQAVPYLCKVHEVSAIRLSKKKRKKEEKNNA